MSDSKKKIFSLLCLLFLSNSAFADNLCDASCILTISFPEGGSITAVQQVTFMFGDAGLIDTGNTAIAYVDGDTRILEAGEQILFVAGGFFTLGTSGNVAYTSMNISTTGDMLIEVVEGAGLISIFNIDLTANTVTLNSDTSINNTLSLTGSTNLVGEGTVTNRGTITIHSGALNISSSLDSSAGSFILNEGSLSVTGSGSLELSGGQLITDASSSFNGASGDIDLEGAFVPGADSEPEQSGNSGAFDALFIYGLLLLPLLIFKIKNLIVTLHTKSMICSQ